MASPLRKLEGIDHIGEFLREHREGMNEGIAQVANRAGAVPSTVTYWETHMSLSAPVLRRIAESNCYRFPPETLKRFASCIAADEQAEENRPRNVISDIEYALYDPHDGPDVPHPNAHVDYARKHAQTVGGYLRLYREGWQGDHPKARLKEKMEWLIREIEASDRLSSALLQRIIEENIYLFPTNRSGNVDQGVIADLHRLNYPMRHAALCGAGTSL